MTKPEGISQSAWDEAEKWAHELVEWSAHGNTAAHYDAHDENAFRDQIARAIDAATAKATERAALIAQNWKPAQQPMTEPTKLYRPFEVADAIATAIRQGSQPSTSIPHMGTVK